MTIRLFLAFFTLVLILIACGEDSVSPPKKDPANQLNKAKSYHCGSLSVDQQSIPIDCYEWGKLPWDPGFDYQPGYHAIQAWWQAASLDPSAKPDTNSKIEIDFAMLTESDLISGKDSVIGFLDYESDYPKYLSLNEGGSFSRWYKDNSFLHLDNAVIQNGMLEIRPNQNPERISHWWMNSKGKYVRRPNCFYQIRCRVRITGSAALQVAADLYKETSSNHPDNTEAFHSAWIGDTKGEFLIICFPQR